MAKFTFNSPGRPKGARNKLTAQVYADVLAFWESAVSDPIPKALTRGRGALEIAFREKPTEFLRAVFSLLPKELAIENVSPRSIEEIEDLKERLIERYGEQISDKATSH
jgi:hypothetical protein